MTGGRGVLASSPRVARGLAVIAVAVVVTGAVFVSIRATAGPPSPTGPVASPTGAIGSSAPSATPADVALATSTPPADLSPTLADAAGVDPTTAFVLKSRSSTTGLTLAQGLETSPPIALAVSPGASDAEAVVTPGAALTPGTLYRFRLRGDGGTVAASWAFRAKSPLQVVSTIPGDEGAAVPVRTGIEVTFDQAPLAGYEGHVSISPTVASRLEVHGRTLVIVPNDDLRAKTLYTVTIARGIGIAGSDVTLEQDVTFRFETGDATSAAGPRISLEKTAIEVPPGAPAELGLSVCCWDGTAWTEGGDWTVATIDRQVDVYRLPSLDAAVAAARTLASAPTWAEWSDSGLVRTADLARVLSFKARLEPADAAVARVRFPTALPAGRYLVVLPAAGRDIQAVLQVTPVATYVRATEDRTVVWVNDTTTGGPVAGATVRLAGGTTLGRTDVDGLLVAATPAVLIGAADDPPTPGHDVVIVTAPGGDAMFVPLGEGGAPYQWEQATSPSGGGVERQWLLFYTDREVYRSSDTIGAWGLVRDRDSGAIPGSVTVRLVAAADQGRQGTPPITSTTVAPDPRTGAFAANLTYDALPLGSYLVELVVDGGSIASVWLTVDVIRKPAWRLDATVDRHVLVSGDPVTVSVAAASYDGSRAPGLTLALSGQGDVRVTTDADGRASSALRASVGSDDTMGTPSVSITAANPEEGEVATSVPLLVFASSAWLSGTAGIEGERLVITGRAQAVDIERLEREFEPWSWISDPGGEAITGTAIRAEIVELIPRCRETGRTYDFVEKVTVPRYECTDERHPLPTAAATSATDGSFTITIGIPDPKHTYEIRLSTTDAVGREDWVRLWAGGTVAEMTPANALPILTAVPAAGSAASCCSRSVGETLDVSLDGRDGPLPAGVDDRFLFMTQQRGLREVSLRSESSYARHVTAADLPDLWIGAVHFDGHTYRPAQGDLVMTVVDPARALTVAVSVDAPRYRPGATVTLTVRTTGPDGAPVPASVSLQVVDEKLYAIGAARLQDPVSDLYAPVGAGTLSTYGSHAVPGIWFGGGGGDTTGGGDGRSEFRDWLLSRLVTTDADGSATVRFSVSDDLTSWRVSAAAVDAGLRVGRATLLVPVGLPFFVDATLAPEYLVGDRPILRLRAYGDALQASDRVSYTVTSTSLGLTGTTLSGRAFGEVRLPLPDLRTGPQSLTIAASVAGHDPPLEDRLVRTFQVTSSRLESVRTDWAILDAAFEPQGGDGLTTYVITDVGRGQLASILEQLVHSDGARVDEAVAAEEARAILAAAFGRDEATLPQATFDPARYQRWTEGVALLPYSSPDLIVTAGVAMAAPEAFDEAALRDAFVTWGALDTATRERVLISLAGRAFTGEDILADLSTFVGLTDLSWRERLYLGLAFSALGDDPAARSIEADALARWGRSVGPAVRLEVSTEPAQIGEATGLFAILAAGLGDPIAARAQASIEADAGREDPFAVERLAYVRRALERIAPEAGRFVYVVDGQERTVDLSSGDAFTLVLTREQRAGLRLEPISGRLAVATSWEAPLDAASTPADPALRIERTVTPSGDLPGDRVVKVTLRVHFEPSAIDGCYQVTDTLPSGLAPLSGTATWPDSAVRGDAPYLVEGQRVSWCASVDQVPRGSDHLDLGYAARVVSPGTYRWEPAMIRASGTGDRVTMTPSMTITIR